MPLIYPKKVLPSGPLNADLLFIGEAPGETEDILGEPFVGDAGRLLDQVLNICSITRSSVRVTNLCGHRPADNNFDYLVDSNELAEGLDDLKREILNHKVVILLGDKPLQYVLHKKGIHRHRGSVYTIGNIKYIPTLHPAAILYSPEDYPLFEFDIKRAISYIERDYAAPTYKTILDPRGMDLIEVTNELCSQPILSIDIESVRDTTHIICVGFAYGNTSVCIVNHVYEGIDLEFQTAISKILTSNVKQVYHNAIFDLEMLRLNGICYNNLYWDTMVAQHALYPELPRSLAFLTSVLTEQNYYKDMGKIAIPDDEKSWSGKFDASKLYTYNCLDCLVTYEIYKKQLEDLKNKPDEKSIFDYEMEMLEVSMHISQSGMLIDQERRTMIKAHLLTNVQQKNLVLDSITRTDFNAGSSKQCKEILYDKFGLPLRYKDKKVTTNEDAIISLIGYTKDKFDTVSRSDTKLEWGTRLVFLKTLLEVRGIRKMLSSYIDIELESDGRIRSSWGVASTETGRWSSYKFVNGLGWNAQTIPREALEI